MVVLELEAAPAMDMTLEFQARGSVV